MASPTQSAVSPPVQLEEIPPWPPVDLAAASSAAASSAEPLLSDTVVVTEQPELDFSATASERAPHAAGETSLSRVSASFRNTDGDVEDSAWRALSAARRQALDVYARHKLPVSPALYRRSGDRHAWRPADDNLTAEQRWEFVLGGSENGWRLVGLERVGRIGRARVIEVQMAASILSLTEALTRRLDESDPGARADMARAFELGRLTAAAEARAELVRRRKRRRARLRARTPRSVDGNA